MTRLTLFACIFHLCQPLLFAQNSGAGDLDLGFDTVNGPNFGVNAVVVQPDGKVLVAGQFSNINGVARNRIARLNADGSLDTGFDPGTGANAQILGLALQPDGKVIIGGYFDSYNGTDRARIARLNADGSLDTGFDPAGGTGDWIETLALQPDGKVVIGGRFTDYNGTTRNHIARVNADGTLDTDFNPGTDDYVLDIEIQAGGKILIAGRFNIVNNETRGRLARLNADGSLDTGFDTDFGASLTVYALAAQADGKVLIGGNFFSYRGTDRNRIARVNADGTLDTGFDPGAGANGEVYALAVQADGKILIGGNFTEYNGTPRNRLARLHAGGSIDADFNIGTGVGASINAIYLLTDADKALIAGNFTDYSGSARPRIARILTECVPPAAPTVASQTRCATGTVTFTATNTLGTDEMVEWSTNNTSWGDAGTTSPAYTVAVGIPITRYARVRNTVTTCASASTTITGTAIALPSVPTIFRTDDVLTSSYTTGNQWLDASEQAIANANGQNYTPTASSTYYVRYTDANSCQATSAGFDFFVTGRASAAALAFSLYPNPASSGFTVRAAQSGSYSLRVVNTQGQVVQQATFVGSQHQVNAATLPAGIYTVQLQGPQGSGVQRMVVQ